jgi:hypothetical protein
MNMVHLAIWMCVLFAGLFTYWARRLNRENAELRRRLVEQERQMEQLQAYARKTIDEASEVVLEKGETTEPVTLPRLLH